MIQLEQGSPEWLEFRNKMIGASDAPIILGISPWRTPQQLWAEKCGFIEPQPINSSMNRGMILESSARKCAEEILSTFFIPEVRVSHDYDWMCASYDGISFDGKILLEIKCTNKKNHAMAMEGKIPDYYRPQLQHQMFVGGFDKCHYFSFDGKNGIVVVEERDDFFIKRLIQKEKEFYHCMITLTEPK